MVLPTWAGGTFSPKGDGNTIAWKWKWHLKGAELAGRTAKRGRTTITSAIANQSEGEGGGQHLVLIGCLSHVASGAFFGSIIPHRVG